MGVVIADPHVQEAQELKRKLDVMKDEEERMVISKELDIAQIKSQLASSRWVSQRNQSKLLYAMN